jgi:2-C-methyl-D-erythritol 4-phosphate cytidylyltransferase
VDKKIYAVIMAAGSGTRMGSELPKQFLPLGGIPILRRTIERFTRACPQARIVTVLPKDSIPWWKEYCAAHFPHCPQILVEGGITRFHSVRNALEKIPDGAVAAIQDGVRPLVSEDLIREMLSRMDRVRALIPVVPMVDTLKVLRRGDDGELHTAEGAAADRTEIFGAQTPQMFRSEDLKEAYSQAFDTAFTDDASVALRKGIPLSYIEGERYNLKITTPDDLALAEAILALKGEV